MNVLLRIILTLVMLVLIACNSETSAAPGQLEITSEPGDAKIFINGKRKGNTPSEPGLSFVIELPEGEYQLKLTKLDGDYEYTGEKEVFIAKDTLQSAKVRLKKQPTADYATKLKEKEEKLKVWGKTHWAKTFGGSSYEVAKAITTTSDDSLVVAGYTHSYGNGSNDMYILRLDTNGNKIWAKTFGGSKTDDANAITTLSDGSLVVAGTSYSYGNGEGDMYILRIDANGNKVWAKTFGGSKVEHANAIATLSDDSLVVAGITDSYGIGNDMYIIRVDANGNKIWEKNFGGNSSESAYAIATYLNDNTIVAGATHSYGNGESDMYVLRLDASGNKIWEKSFGKASFDNVSAVTILSNGRIILAGDTHLDSYGDPKYYVLCLDDKGNKIWEKTFSGSNYDIAKAVTTLPDDSIVIAGYNYPSNDDEDFYLVRLDANGDKIWAKNFGGSRGEVAETIIALSDGSLVVAGNTSSYGNGESDMYILRLDEKGRLTSPE